MALITKYISIQALMDRIYRNTGFKDITEGDVATWASEALGFTNAVSSLEQRVAFGEVIDNKISIPKGLKFIRKIAMHTNFNKNWNTEGICGFGDAFMKDVNKSCPSPDIIKQDKCCEKIELDCNGCPINLAGTVYYRPFFDVDYLHSKLYSHPFYCNNYTPIRLGNDAFFSSLVCKDEECMYSPECPTYTIIGKCQILFSFEEGSVAISYYRYPLDSSGYPLIPDEISFISAIIAYIRFIKAQIYFDTNISDPAAWRKKQDAESSWQWYCGQANEYALLPNSEDEYDLIYANRDNYLPKESYFGHIGLQ
jgi:hypothetical protein